MNIRLFKENSIINMTLLIISIILFAITNYFNLDTLKTILPIFDGIISAAIVAILLDIANEEREKEKLKIEYFQ